MIANRVRVSHGRFQALMEVMTEDIISTDENVRRLGEQLAEHYKDAGFAACRTMGELVKNSIQGLMARNTPATSPLLPVSIEDTE
jgi:hypothetical protein